MKNQEDKELEKVIAEMMEQVPLERSSFDFTSKVMKQIDGLETKSVLTYKPLISTPVWGLLAIMFLGFMGYLFVKLPINNKSLSPNFDFQNIWIMIPSLNIPLHWSQTTMYSLFFLGIMMIFQMSWIKKYFDKKYLF